MKRMYTIVVSFYDKSLRKVVEKDIDIFDDYDKATKKRDNMQRANPHLRFYIRISANA